MNNKVLFNDVLLSTAYMPPIEYFFVMANCNVVRIEVNETYQKQTYRTRCSILSGNGPLVLNIPVLRDNVLGHKVEIAKIKIDYSTDWVIQHKRALEAAYKSSPFFEYYMDDIYAIYDKKHETLFDLNMSFIKYFAEVLSIETPILLTQNFNEEAGLNLKEIIQPKYKGVSMLKEFKMEKPYWQVFSTKQGFVPNLSILDLLFNEGPNAISFLKLKA